MRRHLPGALAIATIGCLVACSDDDASDPVRDGGRDVAEAGAPDAALRPDAPPDAPSEPPTFIGNPCDADEHCLPPARCFRSSDLLFHSGSKVGGPPNGICSIDCNAFADASVCTRTQGPSTCVEIGELGSGVGACLPTCTVGDGDRDKCLGRSDMACVPELAGGVEGRCLPFCEGDYQCPGGHCDLGSGLCQLGPAAPAGAPQGAECQYDGDCKTGLCLRVGSTRFCSGFCGLRGAGCGADPLSPAPLDAVCLFPTSTEADLGDLAFCGQLCDCDGDCRHPLAKCIPFPETHPIRRAARGRSGYCYPEPIDEDHLACAAADGGAPDSSSADAGDAASTGAPDANGSVLVDASRDTDGS